MLRPLAPLVLLAVVLAQAWPGSALASPPPLRVLYSGDVRGHSAPCSCGESPTGSLAQRVALVRGLSSGEVPAVALDAGNLLFPSRVAGPPRQAAGRRLDALTLVDGYGVLGITAVNVGPLDLAEGVEFLSRLAIRSRFPWISSNLRSSESGEPLFSPSVVVSRGGHPVGIVGVMPGGLRGHGWVTTDPLEGARAAAAGLRKAGVETLVLLAATGAREARAIARRVPGVDVVVAAGDRSTLDRAAKVGGAWLVAAGSRGDDVGDLVLSGGRAVVRIHEVSPGLPADPAVARLLDERKARDLDGVVPEG
ncbi:hypothetical protein L6R50_17910 [Myxococcota bacterium]|nr:hypothetical protein [Myxococcota bacterium]